ncbi:hypothetical protein GTZ97_01050 [Aquabacterium fontiphilum]|uniref:hypothetical protein n=1 Tax=Aquabacterium fontiphilum TaxID=450365 RepID=UPI00137689B1|nr:hypothetical protein [Aquabacterium fontiphilum]NBD19258.1 hypothetical protein [Aquabacterium fontiphilum]
MEASLLSPQWFRVAGLRPRLRPQVTVHRQPSRGQQWYVLHNVATGRFHRVHARAFEVVGRLDGELSVDAIWRSLLDQQGDEAPTQDEVLGILGQLADGDLLQADQQPDLHRLAARGSQREQAEQRARVHPLAFRVKLFDPSGWLPRGDPLARVLFHAATGAVWLMLVVSALVAAWWHLPDLLSHARQTLTQPHALLWMWLMYPVLKALHEAGHALALRRYGCTTREVGLSFLLLLPLPHVDATDSLRLTNRWQRAVIVAAGMAVELACAAAAVWVWVWVSPGLARDLALVLMVLGGVSTVLFNGNPLMRYDGYHLVCDVLDLPNLGTRSARHWRLQLQHLVARLLRRPDLTRPDLAGDRFEQLALWLYAPASWWWRVLVGWFVVQWVGNWSPWLAWAAGVWMVWSLLLTPVWRWVAELAEAPALGEAREQVRWMLVGTVAAAIGAVLLWPWTPTLNTQGVAWLPDAAVLRAPHASRVDRVLASDGARVQAGTPLLQLVSEELLSERAVVAARMSATEAERSAMWGTDPVRVEQAEQALRRDQATLDDLDRRLAGLTVRAATAGVFVLPAAEDGLHRDVPQGEVLAHVLPEGGSRVLAVIPEDDAGLWREALAAGSTVSMSVLFADDGRVHRAELVRQVPAALDRLPTRSLGASAGGHVPTDPQDADGLRPLRPVFALELQVPDRAATRVGGRVQVRLDLPPQTLVSQLTFRLRQLLLRQFVQAG